MSDGILLVTPVKDEAAHLKDVIRHVVHQTVRPVRWILVDDHSIDGSIEICSEAEAGYPWIRTLILEGERVERQLGTHVYRVQKIGFDFGTELCRSEGIQYRFLGLLDADMFPETDYFERLLEVFRGDPQMGVASGGVYLRTRGGELKWERSQLRWPRGGARLVRRECFEDTGGIAPVNSGDAITSIRAIRHGYRIGQFKDIKVVQARPTNSALGLRAGFYQRGVDDHFLGYSPGYAFVKGARKCLDFSPVTGLYYLFGYLSSLVGRRERIEDPVVRNFCGHQLLARLRFHGFQGHTNRCRQDSR